MSLPWPPEFRGGPAHLGMDDEPNRSKRFPAPLDALVQVVRVIESGEWSMD